MSTPSRFLVPLLLAVGLLAGCKPDVTQTKAPKIILGATSLDFGRLQVGMQHTLPFKVKNDGSQTLNITQVDGGAIFGTATELPVSVMPGDETELLLTFAPVTLGKREVTTLHIFSDDPVTTDATVLVSGTGVEVAEVAPIPLVFGDVYQQEPKELPVTLTNRSSKPLTVTGVKVTPEGVASHELNAFVSTIQPDQTVTGTVSIKPTQMGDIAGALELAFDPTMRGPLSVPLTGFGTAALPQLCVRAVGGTNERCSPLTSTNANVPTQFKVCDPAVTPDRTCPADTDPAAVDVFLRNAGNIPVPYTVTVTTRNDNVERCGAGVETTSDFSFSTIPVGENGAVVQSMTFPAETLPEAADAPQPWETEPVRVTYRASSGCAAETSDQARIQVSRTDGPTRNPVIVTANFTGASLLPLPKSEEFACDITNSLPCSKPFFGAVNQGEAEVEVRKVTLYEPLAASSAEDTCDELLKGNPVTQGWRACTFDGNDNPLEHCFAFSWEAAEAPADMLPKLLKTVTATPAGSNRAQLGTLEFGANVGHHSEQDCGQRLDGKLCPGANYCLFAVIETSDPYTGTVITPIRAKLTRTVGP